jgi:hypothetical protein
MRTHVSFEAGFPEDATIEGPPGIAIARILQQGLARAGHLTDPPENRDDFAWELECRVGAERFFVLVGRCGDEGGREWLVFSKPAPRFLRGLFGSGDAGEHVALSCAIHAILTADKRFSSVRWYTEADWNHAPGQSWSELPA